MEHSFSTRGSVRASLSAADVKRLAQQLEAMTPKYTFAMRGMEYQPDRNLTDEQQLIADWKEVNATPEGRHFGSRRFHDEVGLPVMLIAGADSYRLGFHRMPTDGVAIERIKEGGLSLEEFMAQIPNEWYGAPYPPTATLSEHPASFFGMITAWLAIDGEAKHGIVDLKWQ